MALGYMLLSLFALQLVGKYYPLNGYFSQINTATWWAFIVAGIGAIALFVLSIVFRKKHNLKWTFGPLTLVLLVISLSSYCLNQYWMSPLPYLYFLAIAPTVAYMIYLLYQREFFLISVLNICFAFGFYVLSKIYVATAVSTSALLVNILLAALVTVIGFVVFVATKNDGVFRLFGVQHQVFKGDTTPLLIYGNCGLCLIFLIASVILGAGFAYYCVFAVAIIELIAGLYYTVKLS